MNHTRAVRATVMGPDARAPELVEDLPISVGSPVRREIVSTGWVAEDAMWAERMLAERAGVGVDVLHEGQAGLGE